MLGLFLGESIFGIILFSVMLDLVFLGVIVGFFFIALAYLAGCESLQKGASEE
jgi:hypothetical protein